MQIKKYIDIIINDCKRIQKGGTKVKKIKKEIKGITILALVVTIIVMLILAGVAINLSIEQKKQ